MIAAGLLNASPSACPWLFACGRAMPDPGLDRLMFLRPDKKPVAFRTHLRYPVPT